MTNSTDPEQIRRDIEQTRRDLSRNVDALTDQVQPGNMARREVNRVGESVRGLKERIMGSNDDDYGYGRGYEPSRKDELMGQAADYRDQAQARLADAREAVSDAPSMARRKTRGNPLGAGLVAFGIGALVGGLMPSSEKERQASLALKDKAAPLVEEAKGLAQESMENLKPQVQEAVQGLKEHAQSSVESVKAEGQDAAATVKASAAESADSVKASAQDAKDEVQAARDNA